MYINLFEQDANTFMEAVASDQRSFNIENFKQALRIAVSKRLLEEVRATFPVVILGYWSITTCHQQKDIQRFAKVVEGLEEASARVKQEDELLADVPEEFLDPIMSTLMTDPVKLPSGKTYASHYSYYR